MLSQRVCREPKVRRLSDAEFRAFIAALCLAGESRPRGCLLLAPGEPMSAADVADEARVPEGAAASMLDQLEAWGTIVADPEQGCLRFTTWLDYQPLTKPSDSAEATRERKRRSRAAQKAATRASSAAAAALAAPPAGSRPGPPPTSGRGRERDRWRAEVLGWLERTFPSMTTDQRRRARLVTRYGEGFARDPAGDPENFLRQYDAAELGVDAA